MMGQFQIKWSLIVVFGFFLGSTVLAEESKPSAINDAEARKVVMFSSTYCPACGHAKSFFRENNIPFMEFDIEKSTAARDYFERLGGRGTPFLLINNRRMHGFNKPRFWEYYRLQSHSSE